jgi:uncharacterized protein
VNKIVRISLGSIAIVLGIVGLVLPILQGWLFLALGALLLSVDVPFFDRVVTWIENRVPPVKKPLNRLRDYLKGSEEKAKEEDSCRYPES